MKACLNKFGLYPIVYWLFAAMLGNPYLVLAESISISPGDTLSSDVLRDLMKPISEELKVDDLVGAWGASQAVCLGGTVSTQRQGLCEGNVELRGSTKIGGGHYERTDLWRIELLDRIDFSVKISSENFNFLFNPALSYLVPNDPITWHCELSASRYLSCVGPENITYDATRGCQHGECLIHVVMGVERASSDSLRLTLGPADTRLAGGSTNLFGLFNTITLNKGQILPIPRLSSAKSTAAGVTLEWAVSNDFSGPFLVRRKDGLNEDFVPLGLVDSFTYTDEVTESGNYWYRVSSEKDGELSLGSNVIRVAVD